MMHGTHDGDRWDVDTPEGLASAVEWMRRHFEESIDNARWVIPRSMSVCVIVQTNKCVIRVAGTMPEPSVRKVLHAIGWKWIEQAELGTTGDLFKQP